MKFFVPAIGRDIRLSPEEKQVLLNKTISSHLFFREGGFLVSFFSLVYPVGDESLPGTISPFPRAATGELIAPPFSTRKRNNHKVNVNAY